MYGGQAVSASMCEAVGHTWCCNCLTARQLFKDSVLCQCDAVCALSWAGCRFVVWQLLWRASVVLAMLLGDVYCGMSDQFGCSVPSRASQV